jgi:uncharacterized protein (TIGR02001 family)
MKKITAIALAAAVSASSLSAQDDSSYSVTMDFSYVSDYVFRGVQFAEESIQPSVEFATGDFYAGIWSSHAVTDTNVANEFDFYMGYGWALNDTWSLDVGATYYDYPETPSGDEQFEPFVGLAGDLSGGFSASAYYFYETEFEVSTFQFDLGYSMEMSDPYTFDIAGNFGSVSPDAGGDYNYYGGSATLNYALTDSAGFYLGVVYAGNDIGDVDEDGVDDVDDGITSFIAGLSIGF